MDYRCPCVIRIPSIAEVWIKKALDIGAAGIIAPGVNSAEEAERIVRMCKYSPRGTVYSTGYTLIAISTDCLHMAQGAGAALKAVRDVPDSL